MRSPLVAATLALVVPALLVIAGCQSSNSAGANDGTASAEVQASSAQRASTLQQQYTADVAGTKVGSVTQVQTIDGTVYVAAQVDGVPVGGFALVIDANEEKVGTVKAFRRGNGETFFEVIDSTRPIKPGDLVVRFPEGTAVELQPTDTQST